MEQEDQFAEKNIIEFINKYGIKGFYELLITNYLFELLMYYLHSERNLQANQKESAAYRFYVDDKEKVLPFEKLEEFREELKKECNKKAKKIVSILEERELIKELYPDKILSTEIRDLMEEALNSIIIKK